MSDSQALFTPFTLGKLELANRLVMAPMTRMASPNNVPNDEVVEYYRRRAAGGAGLIVTEGTCVDHKAANEVANVPFIYGPEALEGWRKVVDAVHAEGGKIAPQLWHVGAVRRPGAEPFPEVPGYGPSGMAKPGKVTGHVMTQADIDDIVGAFAKAAGDAQSLGFDALEVHGAHGYLIDQFFWEETNQRKDGYGGSLEKRSRFAVEIVEAIRAQVGTEFPIIFRFSQWKQQDYDARLVKSPAEFDIFLRLLVQAGVDAFHCSARRFWEPAFDGSALTLAGWTKTLSGKPAIAVGSIGLDDDFLPKGKNRMFSDGQPKDISHLVACIERGEFDLAAIGRAFIANADWPEKIKAGNDSDIVAFNKDMLFSLE